MKLLEKLKNIPTGTKIKVKLTDKTILTGIYDAYTKALDNEPEIASIDLKSGNDIYELYENEILSVEII